MPKYAGLIFSVIDKKAFGIIACENCEFMQRLLVTPVPFRGTTKYIEQVGATGAEQRVDKYWRFTHATQGAREAVVYWAFDLLPN